MKTLHDLLLEEMDKFFMFSNLTLERKIAVTIAVADLARTLEADPFSILHDIHSITLQIKDPPGEVLFKLKNHDQGVK